MTPKELELATAIYNQVSAIAEEAGSRICLIGGAPRDMYLGNTEKVTDFDIYWFGGKPAHKYSKRLIKPSFRKPLSSNSSNNGSPLIDEVRSTQGIPVPIDLIILKESVTTITQVWDDYDLDICRIAWSHKDGFIVSKLFEDSVNTKRHHVRFTAKHRPGQIKKSISDHIPRVLRKYNWPIEVHYYDEQDKELLHF